MSTAVKPVNKTFAAGKWMPKDLDTLSRWMTRIMEKAEQDTGPLKPVVEELKNFIEKDDSGNMHVSSIVPHLINVAVGTMRGILLIKTSGTKLAGYPLPLVNVEELLARSERCPM